MTACPICGTKTFGPHCGNYPNCMPANPAHLEWIPIDGYEDAILGDFDGGDGARFNLSFQPTCYRRGQWKMLIEVAHGPMHNAWGCFDQADQPMRYYHNKSCAHQEAQSIADVLWADRHKETP